MNVVPHAVSVPTTVRTTVGELRVQVRGDGPVALLWHSLFLDSTSWEGLADHLSAVRTLVILDGPGHGRSTGAPAEFSLGDCAAAAAEVLDALGFDGPVDWVGNAWGGHVGYVFAATNAARCRSLVTICTPVDVLTLRDRLVVTSLAYTYRLLGPTQLLTRYVTESLLTKAVARAVPDVAREVGRMFRAPARSGMYRAVRSALLRRPPMAPMLGYITVPALVVGADADVYFTPDQAREVAAQMPHAVAFTVAGGHISPLFVEPEMLVGEIAEFWRDPEGHVRDCR